jgi:hypothetical protein
VSLGSRGTRISLEVLYDICVWTKTGVVNRSLKIENTEGPSKGLFFKLEDVEGGFLTPSIRLGREGYKTTFDILPGYTPPGVFDSTKPDKNVEYVIVHWLNQEKPYFLQLLRPGSNDAATVTATDVLTDRALVKFVAVKPTKKNKVGADKYPTPTTLEQRLQNPFAISIVDDKQPAKTGSGKTATTYWLNVGGEEITDEDEDEDEDNEDWLMGLVKANPLKSIVSPTA